MNEEGTVRNSKIISAGLFGTVLFLGATLLISEVGAGVIDTSAFQIPVGTIVAYGGSVAPNGWLLCDGSAISRTKYAELFAVILERFGAGDGLNSFNLPDMRGRTPIGAGTGIGLTAKLLGGMAGEETHLLTSGESGTAAHSHSITDPGHGHKFTADDIAYFRTGTAYAVTNTGNELTSGPLTIGNATTHITVNNNSAADASVAHNNMQPSIVTNFIIKY